MAKRRPVLLDLYCGAGGCTKGYQEAGFYVIGVDLHEQPRYCGDEFVQDDALLYLRHMCHWPRQYPRFAAIHASPPCHAFSTVTGRNRKNDRRYPNLVPETRQLLEATGLPYVIENVPGAPLAGPILLCGSMFDPPLDVQRHRLFESNVSIEAPSWGCRHKLWHPRFRSLDSRMKGLASVVGVHGHLNYAGEFELRCKAMGIDWMTNAELTQAIPPAYTRFTGEQLMEVLKGG